MIEFTIDILKGQMIDNNVNIYSRKCPLSYHEYKDNWPEGSNFASTLARGQRYFKINIFLPKFLHVQFFYPEVESFTKMESNLVGQNIGKWHSIRQSFPHHNFALYGSRFNICSYIIMKTYLNWSICIDLLFKHVCHYYYVATV